MKSITAIALFFSAPLFGAYSYFYTGSFGAPDAVTWQANGSLGYGAGLTSTSVGSLIYKQPSPGSYEVAAMLRIPASGGRYFVFLAASQNAQLSDAGPVGTFYAAEIWNPQQLSTGGCSANLYLWKSVNSSLSLLSSSTITCKADTQIRAVIKPGLLTVNVNNTFQAWYPENVLAGQPGVGVANVPPGNSITLAQFGNLDTTPPNAIPRESIISYLAPNSVQLRWQAPPDDPTGTGVVRYDVYRTGAAGVGYGEGGYLDDRAVVPGTTYTYTLFAVDYHFNYSAATVLTVTTPPAGAVDPNQIGVRPTGTYWGAQGEQIDLRVRQPELHAATCYSKGPRRFRIHTGSQLQQPVVAIRFRGSVEAGSGRGLWVRIQAAGRIDHALLPQPVRCEPLHILRFYRG